MSGSSSTSFIPKHTPNKPERRSSPRQVFFGTVLVRILFAAVIIATAGVYLYTGKLERELMVEVTNFNAATSNYEKDTDRLEAIVAMDNRLSIAGALLAKGVSLNALFAALERSVIGTVQLSSLSIEYDNTNQLLLTANVDTDTFDSTMFQRSVLEESDVFNEVEIGDVTIVKQGSEAEDNEESVTFTATITVDPAAVPAVVVRDSAFVPVSEPPVEMSLGTGVETQVEASEAAESIDTSDNSSVDGGFES